MTRSLIAVLFDTSFCNIALYCYNIDLSFCQDAGDNMKKKKKKKSLFILKTFAITMSTCVS